MFYKRNKRIVTYCASANSIASPIDGPEIPQGPFGKCVGCPYPRHGFICWGKDGSCLRTDMNEIERGNKHDSNAASSR